MNMFYHPCSIINRPRVREAIDELLRYVEFKGTDVLHMGNDEVWRWWDARSQATLEEVSCSEGQRKFRCQCNYSQGMIVKIFLDENITAEVSCDGKSIAQSIKKEFGKRWLYMVIPKGQHEIEVINTK